MFFNSLYKQMLNRKKWIVYNIMFWWLNIHLGLQKPITLSAK